MSIKIVDVANGLRSQQLSALKTILVRARDYSNESGVEATSLLETRLYPDMHPLSWQIQTVAELIQRGIARLRGEEPQALVLDENNFDALISRLETIQADLMDIDLSELDKAASKTIEFKAGPDNTLSFSSEDYVVKFLLPNIFFHLTTTYDLLRMSGVPLTKGDYMGAKG